MCEEEAVRLTVSLGLSQDTALIVTQLSPGLSGGAAAASSFLGSPLIVLPWPIRFYSKPFPVLWPCPLHT
jgi:hypothetical protein